MGRRTNEELKSLDLQPRKKGEGTVFPMKNRPGIYRAVRVIEIDGKLTQISGNGTSPEQAIQRRERNVFKKLGASKTPNLQAKVIQQAVAATKGLNAKSTFHEVMLDWLEWRRYQTSPSKKISGAVRKQYETHIRLHLGPSEMGQTPIDELSRPIIENYFFRELPRDTKIIWRDGENQEVPKLSISNQRAQQSIVNMVLNYAVYPLALIPSNPSIGMDRIQKEDNITANTELEKKRKMAYKLAMLLEGHKDEARWMFQLLTGTRQSEVLGLRWSDSFMYLLEDYDPKRPARVIIKQQLVRDPYGDGLRVKQRTKSKSSTRVIPLDPRLVEILLNHRARQEDLKQRPEWQPLPEMDDLVFCEASGKPTSHQRDHKRFKAMLRSFADVLEGDEISMHGLRHLAASIMVTSGATIEQVKNMLGHASSAVTSAVYLHIGAQNLVEPVSKYTTTIFRDRDRRQNNQPIPPYNDDDFNESNPEIYRPRN